MGKDEYYKNFNAFLKSMAQAQRLVLMQDDAITSDERKWEIESFKSYLSTGYLTGMKLYEIVMKEERHNANS